MGWPSGSLTSGLGPEVLKRALKESRDELEVSLVEVEGAARECSVGAGIVVSFAYSTCIFSTSAAKLSAKCGR